MMLVKNPIKASMKPLWSGRLLRQRASKRHSCNSRPLSQDDCIFLPLILHLPGVSPLPLSPLICLKSSVAPAAFSVQTICNKKILFHSLGTAQNHVSNGKELVPSHLYKTKWFLMTPSFQRGS